jgi:ABC-type transport system involved in multi-copper enzyme maturation permease subunit
MRFWAALLVLGVWQVLLTKSGCVSPAQMGQHLLNALGVLTIGFSMLAGVFLTSDCLSEEMREGTLGLLFLTDLKSYDVVLGKLAANSLNAFFGLVAVFPILGLALLLGGVTGSEFWRLLLVYTTTLFFSLSLGILVSSVSRDAKQAIMRAFFLMALLAGVFPALWWFQWSVWNNPSLDFLLLPSPPYAYLHGFDMRYRFGNGAREFWSSLVTIFGLGLACLAIATVVLPRLWQEKGQRESTRVCNPLRRLLPARNAAELPRLPAVTWQNPAYWLTVRDPSPRRLVARMFLFLLPIWFILLCASVASPKHIPAFIACFLVAYGLHLIVKVLIIAEASRRINLDRHSGALELLLVTPLPIRVLLAGQKAALRCHFRVALLMLCLLNAALTACVFLFPKSLQMGRRDTLLFSEIFLGGIVALFFDFNALGWVAMWRGLNSRQHHRAVVRTLLQLMGIPWLMVFFLIFLEPNVGGDGGVAMVIGFWFAVGIVVDLVSAAAARTQLTLQFRLAAAQRFDGKPA